MTFMSLGRQSAAGILSILVPGAGQALNRQWRKAACLLSLNTAILLAGGFLKLLHTFPGFVLWILVTIPLSIFIFIEAVWTARKPWEESPSPSARSVYGLVFFLLAGWHLYAAGSDFYLDQLFAVRSFRVPVVSMAPTLQEGDRLVADMHAFADGSPERGDLVVFALKGQTLYIKRIIAVGGDTILGDSQNIVLNGSVLRAPYLIRPKPTPSDLIPYPNYSFKAVTLPQDTFFVVGDNLSHSFDSRFEEHGLVTRDQIRGKPLFIYWSADKKRIGTTLH